MLFKESGIQVPLTKNLKLASTWNPASTVWNPESKTERMFGNVAYGMQQVRSNHSKSVKDFRSRQSNKHNYFRLKLSILF